MLCVWLWPIIFLLHVRVTADFPAGLVKKCHIVLNIRKAKLPQGSTKRQFAAEVLLHVVGVGIFRYLNPAALAIIRVAATGHTGLSGRRVAGGYLVTSSCSPSRRC